MELGDINSHPVVESHKVTTELIVHRVPVSESNPEKERLLRTLGIDVYDYISQHLNPERSSVQVLNASTVTDLDPSQFVGKQSLVNLAILNRARYINRFLNTINHNLPDAAIYIGCIETSNSKKNHLYRNGRNLFKTLYWIYCFVVHRVFPKMKFTQKLYFWITRGRYRWLTLAEVLGRLVSCGFEIIEYKEIKGVTFYVVMKTRLPHYDQNPSYGPIFPMKRIGKNGKLIKVYKFRTMHPYAEYLQDYIVKLNGYNDVGKPAGDFRLTPWGKFFRKYWLDELPQLYNVLKGDLGIVGVRPLSKTRFNELPEDVRLMRVRFKPGCIPPYVALLMPDALGNIEAERIYMKAKLKHPVMTDVKFLILSVYNILTGKIRSS
jgi:lipopolysaccharide/colanic/teichoic acid biosynthesis glycosyltransferase